jgi:hypothetical protein
LEKERSTFASDEEDTQKLRTIKRDIVSAIAVGAGRRAVVRVNGRLWNLSTRPASVRIARSIAVVADTIRAGQLRSAAQAAPTGG